MDYGSSMMRVSEQFAAYVATLIALVVVVVIAVAFSAFSGAGIDKLEALGVGTVIGGLLGLARGVSGAAAAPQVTVPPEDSARG